LHCRDRSFPDPVRAAASVDCISVDARASIACTSNKVLLIGAGDNADAEPIELPRLGDRRQDTGSGRHQRERAAEQSVHECLYYRFIPLTGYHEHLLSGIGFEFGENALALAGCGRARQTGHVIKERRRKPFQLAKRPCSRSQTELEVADSIAHGQDPPTADQRFPNPSRAENGQGVPNADIP
jgi:hypothetical protein